MSLIVTLPTSEGVVIANDMSFGVGQSREKVSKIYQLNSKICWSASGEYSLVQRANQAFLGFQDTTLSLKELAAPIGSILKACIRDLLSVDFRTEIYISNFQAITQLHRADFVFVEWAQGPVILHINVLGSPVWVTERPFVLGAGDSLAGCLLQRYRDIPMTLTNASLLAYRVVDEAIETGMFGLAGPVDIWQATAQGARQLSEVDTMRIAETLKTVRRDEAAVFEHHLAASISH